MNDVKNIAIIGGDGFIGGHLFQHLNGLQNFAVCKTHFHRKRAHSTFLDVTNTKLLESFLVNHDNHNIILLSALKDVKQCEIDPDETFKLNTQPIKDIISIIRDNNLYCPLLYFSSDYVFRGDRGNYCDHDKPDPTTCYGRTKYWAEEALQASDIDYKILRPSAVMGRGGVFFEWLLNSLRTTDEIKMFSNVYFSPTPINLLSIFIENIIYDYDIISDKIIHLVGAKRMSRFDFGLFLNSLYNQRARIYPELFEPNQGYFQNDLSLIPSNILRKYSKHSYEEYFKDIYDANTNY